MAPIRPLQPQQLPVDARTGHDAQQAQGGNPARRLTRAGAPTVAPLGLARTIQQPASGPPGRHARRSPGLARDSEHTNGLPRIRPHNRGGRVNFRTRREKARARIVEGANSGCEARLRSGTADVCPVAP